jgi:hypothetical protein
VPGANADVCPRCSGRAEQIDEAALEVRALSLLAQSTVRGDHGKPVLDQEQMEAFRTKIEKVLKTQPQWPNTGWFNDGNEPSESEGACDCAIRIIKNLKAKLNIGEFLTITGEELAQFFHERYERLARDFGYKTTEASAKPWGEVPEDNKRLMIATAKSVLAHFSICKVQPMTKDPTVKDVIVIKATDDLQAILEAAPIGASFFIEPRDDIGLEPENFSVIDGKVKGTLKHRPQPGTLVFSGDGLVSIAVNDFDGDLLGTCVPGGRINYESREFSFELGPEAVHPSTVHASYNPLVFPDEQGVQCDECGGVVGHGEGCSVPGKKVAAALKAAKETGGD